MNQQLDDDPFDLLNDLRTNTRNVAPDVNQIHQKAADKQSRRRVAQVVVGTAAIALLGIGAWSIADRSNTTQPVITASEDSEDPGLEDPTPEDSATKALISSLVQEDPNLSYGIRSLTMKLTKVNGAPVDPGQLGDFEGFYWWIQEVTDENGDLVYVSHTNNANKDSNGTLENQCGTMVRGRIDFIADGTISVLRNDLPQARGLADEDSVECAEGLTSHYRPLFEGPFTVSNEGTSLTIENGDQTATFVIR